MDATAISRGLRTESVSVVISRAENRRPASSLGRRAHGVRTMLWRRFTQTRVERARRTSKCTLYRLYRYRSRYRCRYRCWDRCACTVNLTHRGDGRWALGRPPDKIRALGPRLPRAARHPHSSRPTPSCLKPRLLSGSRSPHVLGRDVGGPECAARLGRRRVGRSEQGREHGTCHALPAPGVCSCSQREPHAARRVYELACVDGIARRVTARASRTGAAARDTLQFEGAHV